MEDGSTHKHITWQLIGLVTIFPGDKPLIQGVFLGAPWSAKHDAITTSKNIYTVVNPHMSPDQYLGSSVDGATYLCHVGEQLDLLIGVDGHHDWDGVHHEATVDTGLRNPRKPWANLFEWLNKMTEIISKANRFINWGIEYDRFFRVSFSKT